LALAAGGGKTELMISFCSLGLALDGKLPALSLFAAFSQGIHKLRGLKRASRTCPLRARGASQSSWRMPVKMRRQALALAFRTRRIIKLHKRQFSMKIHFMDICPCLKHTNGLIFSSLVVKRSFIGVSMKINIAAMFKYEFMDF
jgi:hypothetical protein